MSEITLRVAAERLAISPLEVVLRCSLHGIPCPTGLLDEAVLPVLGPVRAAEPDAPPPVPPAVEESEAEARLRIVRRILERLSGMGKFWPARTERRATARGLAGPEVGLALRAVDTLVACGLMREDHRGGHEPRVGLNGDRRREIAEVIEGQPVADQQLRAWIAEG